MPQESTLRQDLSHFLIQLKGMEESINASRKANALSKQSIRDDAAAGILNYVNVIMGDILDRHSEVKPEVVQ